MASMALHKQFRRQVPHVAHWGAVAWQWREPQAPTESTKKGWWPLWMGVGLLCLGAAGLYVLTRQSPSQENVLLEELVIEVPPPPPVASTQIPEVTPAQSQPENSSSTEPTETKSVEAVAPILGTSETPNSLEGVEVPQGNSLQVPAQPQVSKVQEASAGDGPQMLASVPGSVASVVPVYPVRAEAEGREGTVVALVTTDTLGRVVDWRIEKSAGRDFDESVRRAVLATRYQVPMRNGRAQAVVFRLPYRFRLE